MFSLLRAGFTLLPIAFGLDTFFDLLTDRSQYLAPWADDLLVLGGFLDVALRDLGPLLAALALARLATTAPARGARRS